MPEVLMFATRLSIPAVVISSASVAVRRGGEHGDGRLRAHPRGALLLGPQHGGPDKPAPGRVGQRQVRVPAQEVDAVPDGDDQQGHQGRGACPSRLPPSGVPCAIRTLLVVVAVLLTTFALSANDFFFLWFLSQVSFVWPSLPTFPWAVFWRPQQLVVCCLSLSPFPQRRVTLRCTRAYYVTRQGGSFVFDMSRTRLEHPATHTPSPHGKAYARASKPSENIRLGES